MTAFLNFLEKILTWFFSLAFGALIIYGGLRYSHYREDEANPWVQAQKKNTAEAYLEFLRGCQSCPQQQAAKKQLDELQRVTGLLSRLGQEHLPARAGITLPVFSPDGKVILATGGRGPDFWDAETGRRDSHGDKTFTSRGGRDQVDALDFARDGRRIGAGMAGREGGRLMVWVLTTEALIAEHEVEGFDVKTVLFSPDSVWLGWRGEGPVGLWNPVSGKFLRSTHAGVTSIGFHNAPNGRTYFITAAGRELSTWEMTSMELVKEQRIDSDRPLLGISRDGRVIAYSDGKVLEIWDTVTAKALASLRDLQGDITAFCRDTATGRIVVGTQAGFLYLWDPLVSPLPQGHVAAHEGPIDAVSCGAEARAVSTGWDGAKVWNLEKLKVRPPETGPRRHR
jgi:hypothetical protein